MKININDMVKVKLTDFGKEIWYHQNDKINKWAETYGSKIRLEPVIPVVDKDGWMTEQLWVLMNVFGEHIYNGSKLCFETTIEIIKARKTKVG